MWIIFFEDMNKWYHDEKQIERLQTIGVLWIYD